MEQSIKLLSFDVFKENEKWIYNTITQRDAQAIKWATLSSDQTQLFLYREISPSSSATPAFVIDIPTTSLDGVIKKVANATAGHVATFLADGTIQDSGIVASELAKKSEVTKEISEKISQASHMQKEIVTELPSSDAADANTFYLLKIASATGKDKYEIYTLIGNEVILIDDTSVDLSGYSSTEQMVAAIGTAKTEAISQSTAAAATDATSKANKALSDAKAYSDSKTSVISGQITTLTTSVDGHTTSIQAINTSLSSQSDRISALENEELLIATEAEALAAFNEIFGTAT